MTAFSAMTRNVENLFRSDPEDEVNEQEQYQDKLRLLAASSADSTRTLWRCRRSAAKSHSMISNKPLEGPIRTA